MRNNTLATALLTAFFAALAGSAQLADVWDARADKPVSHDVSVMRGEDIVLAPRLTLYGSPVDLSGSSATFWWQTNGMGSAWWGKPALVSASETGRVYASWSRADDVGAASYVWFVGIDRGGTATAYRAFGRLDMRHSPGWNPSVAVPPSAYGDLAGSLLRLILPSVPTHDAWTNEAALRQAADDALGVRIDALAASGGYTGSVSAATSETALNLQSADSNWLVSVSASGTSTLFRASYTNWVVLSPAYADLWPAGVGTQAFPFATSTWSGFVSPYSGSDWSAGDYVVKYIGSGTVFDDGYWACRPPSSEASVMTFVSGEPIRDPPGTCVLHRVKSWIPAGVYATHADLSAAVSNSLASFSPAALTNAIAVASNAFVRATNAQASASAVDARLTAATNAIVRTYFLSTNAWISADFSNRTVSVSMLSTNGATNTVEVGSAGNAVDPEATNLLWQALSSVGSSLAGKADKAWGKYTPGGEVNPDPSYMTWLNAPSTLFASGASWITYGTYAVLISTGTVAFAAGGDGSFRIGPDSTNHFGYTVGGSVFVGALADSLNVVNGGAAGGYAEITYLYEGGDFPTLWFTPSLAVDFTELSGVWVDNLDGTATVTAPAEAGAGFYKATTSAAYSTVFRSTMPARFDGGVFGSTNAAPVVYDSTITITSGGHTYRIPAQLAE